MTPTSEPALTVPREVVDHLIHANFWDPFSILGSHEVEHEGKAARAIRAFLPEAKRAWVVVAEEGRHDRSRPARTGSTPTASSRRSSPTTCEPFPYRLAIEGHDGHTWEIEDPYRFGPVLTDFDLHLLGEGTHYKSYEKLGAHVRTHEGVKGVHFAVWAPNALRVSVVGDFNGWDGRRHPMRSCSGGLLGDLPARPDPGRGLQVRDQEPVSTATSSRRPTPTASRPRSGPRRRRSSGTSPSSTGMTTTGCSRGPSARRSTRRSRSTRSISAPGSASPRRGIASSTIESWPTTWSSTSRRPASPTSS